MLLFTFSLFKILTNTAIGLKMFLKLLLLKVVLIMERKIRMAKIPTIYDVSRKAGVSTATVSRVLNNPGKVNADTRKLVESAISELGYKPLLEMRLRGMKDVPRICVCTPHFSSQSYVQRLRGIDLYLESLDYETELYIQVVNSQPQLEHFINTISSRDIDGVIFVSLALTEEQIRKVKEAGVQCVLIENQSHLCTCIDYDNFEGGRIAARYLLDKGFESFGILSEPFHWEYTVYSMQDRFMGFQAEIGAAGYTIPKENIYENQIDYHLVRRQFTEVFRSGKYPQAFFVPADLMAFGMIQAAKDCGLTPGKDISIIGFDDIDYADVFELTTVSQHLDESGEVAAKALMEKLRDPEKADQQIMLSLTIVTRKSA